jgi:DNA-directed RNA polymerase subunit M
MFCPKCGSILVQKTKRYGCPKCNYSSKDKVKIESTEKMKEKKEIGVLREKDTNVWPVTAATCPKCGHEEAFFWSAQMRAGDEAETRFFRCTKCKHTWREYK